MSENKPPFHPFLHKFLIYFAMWAFAFFGVAYGIRYMIFASENGARAEWIFHVLSAALIAVSLFLIKVRFDLAAFRDPQRRGIYPA